ncbi:WD repeat-containing protein [Aureococcus anophagefferens]|nr:WD repeat-containing protein [Aureococcus anophagefferens]
MPAEDLPIELEHAIGLSTLRGGLHYHPNGREYLYAAGASIVVCDFEDPHAQAFLRGHDDSITCVAMSAKGALVASGQRGENADAIVWDYERKSLLFRLSEHDHAATSTTASLVWDMANGCIADDGVREPSPTVCVAWGGFVKDVKRRDTQDYLFCTAGGKKLSLWSLNPTAASCRRSARSTDGRGCTVREMTWVEFSEDRETIYCGTTSGDFTLVNVRKRSASGTTVFASRSGVESLLAKPDGGLVTGGGDGTVTAFDAKLHDVAQVQLPGAVVAARSPDRGELIAGVAPGAIYRLRGDLGKALLVCENHARPVVAVAYSADSSDNFLCWELRNEKRMTSHTQRMGGINSIALSKDQTNVFTVGQEKRLTRWDRDQNFLGAGPQRRPLAMGMEPPSRVRSGLPKTRSTARAAAA